MRKRVTRPGAVFDDELSQGDSLGGMHWIGLVWSRDKEPHLSAKKSTSYLPSGIPEPYRVVRRG
jgi:hypothetical protein